MEYKENISWVFGFIAGIFFTGLLWWLTNMGVIRW